MKHLAAYALLVLGGKAEPTEADVENVLKEAGVKADPEQLKTLMGAVKGKKLHELIAAGMSKISAGAAAAPAKAEKKEAKPEPKKEAKKEKKEEKHEEPADAGLAGGLNIFGDDM